MNVTTTLPRFRPVSTRACAAAISSNVKRESISGVKRPSTAISTSVRTSSTRSAAGPATIRCRDVTFTNGASLFVEASWALNVQDSREGCVTLMGTEGGAETAQAKTGADLEVTLNNVQGGDLVKTKPEVGAAYFGAPGGAMNGFAYMGGLEAASWLDAITNDTDPYVTAEQACVVTEILDAIYTSAETGQPVLFNQN